MTTKTVIEIPEETLDLIRAKLAKIDAIHEKLMELEKIETPTHYTPREFMKLAKIGRNKFEQIKPKLSATQVSSRKILIPHSDLVRWFNGELA